VAGVDAKAARPPAVYGPAARYGPLSRLFVLLVAVALAGYLVWLAGTGMGRTGRAMPPTGGLGRGGALALLLAALALLAGVFASRAPVSAAIIEVSDEGVTTRMIGARPMPAVFVPHADLRAVEVVPMRGGERMVTIRARPGAARTWFQVRSRDMTGTDGLEIARQIARRARDGGLTVQGPEARGFLGADSVWIFGPP
jgi:hypothetical protein